jgi:hypothetical protein
MILTFLLKYYIILFLINIDKTTSLVKILVAILKNLTLRFDMNISLNVNGFGNYMGVKIDGKCIN